MWGETKRAFGVCDLTVHSGLLGAVAKERSQTKRAFGVCDLTVHSALLWQKSARKQKKKLFSLKKHIARDLPSKPWLAHFLIV